MIIKFLTDTEVPNLPLFRKDSEVEVEDSLAHELIDQGHAEFVGDNYSEEQKVPKRKKTK